MTPSQIRFDDGAAYEDFMGKWSQLAGRVFLDWLDAPAGGRWADIGCGNGAFTELVMQRCAPAEVHGIDPSPEQIAYARERAGTRAASFEVGGAEALPYADRSFDAAVMALVIFFVPDPARGVAEMARIVRPGGSVSAYAWDMFAGGFPFAAVHEEMAALGAPPALPPSAEASRMDVLRSLWTGAGLVSVETTVIEVQRSFEDFESFWRVARSGPRIAPSLASMPAGHADELKRRVQARLPADAQGRITYGARANAIRGRVPG